MSWADRLTILVATGVISTTLGIGACQTGARINDVNDRINNVQTDIRNLRADVQADIRELRTLVVDAIAGGQHEARGGVTGSTSPSD